MTPDEWVDKIVRDLAYKAPELWDGYLRVTLKTAINQNTAPAILPEQYVVVTVVEDGPVHVYSRPEPMDKPTARKLNRELVQKDEVMHPDAPDNVRTCVRKILTGPPADKQLTNHVHEEEVPREVWGGDELIGPEEPA